ncbi:metallophosphoesterase family protein [Orbus mooreae]|uniref:metallophosphoesterase family protein n=1 Tax=Orbus mooreae TaxID=3074107 RepID=UPI00370D60ED
MLAFISDIHGNYPALSAVFDDLDNYNVKQIISLGDVCGYYAEPNQCIEALISKKVINILGNHDNYIITNTKCSRSNSANACLDYQRKILKPENIGWLKQSLLKYDTETISCVHGGWSNFLDEYLAEINENYFMEYPQRFFFSGHTHIQKILFLQNKLYCNPGSVGQPRDGNPNAAYALFDGESIYLKRVKYDIDQTAKQMEIAGFSNYFYRNLYFGLRIGDNNIKTAC